MYVKMKMFQQLKEGFSQPVLLIRIFPVGEQVVFKKEKKDFAGHPQGAAIFDSHLWR